MPRPRQLAFLGLALLRAAAAACQARSGPERVRGLVIAVEAHSLARADRLTLRTEDGRELVFTVDASVDWTPGHLREHMALGAPVIVEYVARPEGLVAVRIDDG